MGPMISDTQNEHLEQIACSPYSSHVAVMSCNDCPLLPGLDIPLQVQMELCL